MSWSLKKHILDHAFSVVNNLSLTFNENEPKNQHFTLSIDIAQLIVKKRIVSQNDIDKIMMNFMNDLVKHQHIFEESKGRSISGKQLRRKVIFNFDKALVAYHNSGSDSINSKNYSVEPHLHLLFDKTKKLGIGYHQLIVAINKISLKHGLIFNFQEEVKDSDKFLKTQASNFTWFTKRSSDSTFISKVNNRDKLITELDMFTQHYKNTANLQYYIKGMRDFQERLKFFNIDFLYNGLNLKEEFPLYLSSEQLDTLKTLHQGDREEIYGLLNDRSNKIARAFIEYQFGFNNIIMDELTKRNYSPLKFEIDIRKLDFKITHKKNTIKNSYEKTINFCYKSDMTQALSIARNEKELQEVMKSLGYKDFAYKQKTVANKRSKVGFTFTNINNKKVTVYYSSLKLSAGEVRTKLVKNSKTLQEPQFDTLNSFLNDYIPLVRKSKSNVKFEKIYNFDTSFDLTNWHIEEVDNHVELKNETTHIIDSENRIFVKKQNNDDITKNAQLLIDMAIAKGWDLEKLFVSGTEEFKLAIKNEISSRNNDGSNDLHEAKSTEIMTTQFNQDPYVLN